VCVQLGEGREAEERSYWLPVPEREGKWWQVPLSAVQQQEERQRARVARREILTGRKDDALRSEVIQQGREMPREAVALGNFGSQLDKALCNLT